MGKFATIKIVILDSCLNYRFLEIVQQTLAKVGDGRSVGRGLAGVSELGQQKLAHGVVKTYGMIIAYAAAPGASAADSVGRNSPDTAAPDPANKSSSCQTGP